MMCNHQRLMHSYYAAQALVEIFLGQGQATFTLAKYCVRNKAYW